MTTWTSPSPAEFADGTPSVSPLRAIVAEHSIWIGRPWDSAAAWRALGEGLLPDRSHRAPSDGSVVSACDAVLWDQLVPGLGDARLGCVVFTEPTRVRTPVGDVHVRVAFAMFSSADDPAGHARLISRLAQVCDDPARVEALAAARSPSEFVDALELWDAACALGASGPVVA